MLCGQRRGRGLLLRGEAVRLLQAHLRGGVRAARGGAVRQAGGRAGDRDCRGRDLYLLVWNGAQRTVIRVRLPKMRRA